MLRLHLSENSVQVAALDLEKSRIRDVFVLLTDWRETSLRAATVAVDVIVVDLLRERDDLLLYFFRFVGHHVRKLCVTATCRVTSHE